MTMPSSRRKRLWFDDRTVARRLDEQLVVPESDRAAQKLFRHPNDSRQKQQIMERGRYAPGAECMEKYGSRIARFVDPILIPSRVRGLTRFHKHTDLIAKNGDLRCGKDRNIRNEPVGFERSNLCGIKPDRRISICLNKQIREWRVSFRQVSSVHFQDDSLKVLLLVCNLR